MKRHDSRGKARNEDIYFIHEGHEETRRIDLTAKDAKEREGKTSKVILVVIAVLIPDMEGRNPVWSCYWTWALARGDNVLKAPLAKTCL